MSFALDIILICILVIAILIGVKRGFVRSAARFIGTIFAAVISSVLGGMAATGIYNALFRGALVERVNESVSGLTNAESAMGVLSSLPDFIVRALEEAGITEASLNAQIASGRGQIADTIVDVISPVFIGFIKVLAVIVIFMILMVVVRLLANFLDRLFDLPILGAVNSLLGGVFGVLSGVLIIWIVLGIMIVFIPMLSSDMQTVVESSINDSALASFFTGFNPLAWIFK